MQTTLRIEGMSCGHCVRAVENRLRKIAGVREVQVTLGQAIVTTDGPIDPVVLREAIRDEGYEVA